MAGRAASTEQANADLEQIRAARGMVQGGTSAPALVSSLANALEMLVKSQLEVR